ncbi:MAG: DUF3127 domain-containing protein [Deltaproteobacteria bacterium]
MGMEIGGRIYKIEETKQITERFRKREFVLVLEENSEYPQYVQFQLTGNRVDKINDFKVGDEVKVDFSLRGREWTSPKNEIRYFNSLDVWDLIRIGDQQQAADDMPFGDAPPPSDEEMPF